jgi:predicted nuclease with RNAse H fold
VHYCGVVPVRGALQLTMLEEVRVSDPPVRLSAIFFEPGSAAEVGSELRALADVVVAVGAPLAPPREGRPGRDCDALLLQRGVAPQAADRECRQLVELLPGMRSFSPANGGLDGPVGEGAYRDFPLFETNPDGVFCALQGRRLPAKRHPLGMQLRIDALAGDRVMDEGGDLWHRRIEELDAAACALCAHRYAVGHACWLGDPDECVLVLPGSSVPDEFAREGVLPPVERLKLPPLGGAGRPA